VADDRVAAPLDVGVDAEGRTNGGGVEHVSGSALGQDLPVPEDQQLVGEGSGVVQLVQDGHDREAVAGGQVAQQLEQLELVADVEERGGLVEQQQRRLLRERDGDPDPLAFAAGELDHQAVGEGLDARGGHRPAHRLGIGVGGTAEEAPVRVTSEQDELADRDAVGHQRRLRKVGQSPGQRSGAERVEPVTVDEDGARLGGGQPGEDAQQRRLPRAVGADQHGAGPRRDRQPDPAHDGGIVVAHGQSLGAQEGGALSREQRAHLPMIGIPNVRSARRR
jgi:hypothetical protein